MYAFAQIKNPINTISIIEPKLKCHQRSGPKNVGLLWG